MAASFVSKIDFDLCIYAYLTMELSIKENFILIFFLLALILSDEDAYTSLSNTCGL